MLLAALLLVLQAAPAKETVPIPGTKVSFDMVRLEAPGLRPFLIGDPAESFTCPVSGGEYVYNPDGLRCKGPRPCWIIIYDAAPSHTGYRWAVVVPEVGSGQAPVTDVDAFPESQFAGVGGRAPAK